MAKRCADCPYGGQAIGPLGDIDSEIVLVGEAPGGRELLDGRPFIGPSGELLWETMRLAGVPDAEKSCYVTNTLSCRPPTGDAPSDSAIAACRPRLMREIAHHPRRVVVTMGNTATHSVLGNKKLKIGSIRGRPQQMEDGTTVMPTWHPAAILRSGGKTVDNPKYKQYVADMFKAVKLANGEELERPNETIWWDIQTEKQARRIIRTILRKRTYLACDIETTGLNARRDRITCLGVAYDRNNVVIFPEKLIYGSKVLRELFDDPEVQFIWHNGKFDCEFLRNAGLGARVDHDTMLLHYALNESRGGHGLKELSHEYLGAEDYEQDVSKAAKNKKKNGFADVPLDLLYPYLAYDCDYTLQLFLMLYPKVERESNLLWLYENVLLPASQFLQRVERRGVYVDTAKLHELRTWLEPRRDEALARAQDVAAEWWAPDLYVADTGAKKRPDAFNMNSPKQLEWMLFTRLQIAPPPGVQANTREDNLRKLPTHPIVDALLEYREVSKALSTYVEGIESRLEDGSRVHSTFLIHGTETGRLSSGNPNMQNIPRPQDGELVHIKDIFAAPPGRKLLELDYSAAELRVLAILSKDPYLMRCYQEGRDLHAEMARSIFGDDFTDEQRTYAKRLNFGIAYGMTAKLLAHMLEIELRDADHMINVWFERCPRAKRFLDRCRYMAFKMHMVETCFGRRRRFPLVTAEAMHGIGNEACNFPIQSIASDLTLLSGIELEAPLALLDTHIVNIVHDALVMEVPDDEAVIAQVYQMTHAKMIEVPFRELGPDVPFEADAKVGCNWGSLAKYPPKTKVVALAS